MRRECTRGDGAALADAVEQRHLAEVFDDDRLDKLLVLGEDAKVDVHVAEFHGRAADLGTAGSLEENRQGQSDGPKSGVSGLLRQPVVRLSTNGPWRRPGFRALELRPRQSQPALRGT